jgi:fatty acid desaturase
MSERLDVNSMISDDPFAEILEPIGLTKRELQELHTINVRLTIVHLLATVVSGLMIPVIWWVVPHPVTFIVCVLFSLRNFSCFAQLVHGSDHNMLFPTRASNNFWGNVAANFIGYTRQGHGLTHMRHHHFLNTDRDPDLIFLDSPDPEKATIRGILLNWMKDLCFYSAIRRLMQYMQPNRSGYQEKPWTNLTFSYLFKAAKLQLPVVLVQGALLGFYSWLIGPEYYFLFHVVPLMTLYPALIRIRSAVEHGFEPGFHPKTPEDVLVTRSTRANMFERLIISPLYMPYHFEHHLLPSVPYYNLPDVQKLLKERLVSVPEADGYIQFIINTWKRERKLDLA